MHVVMLSKAVPYEGIPHAGGEFVRLHVKALLELGHQVTVVAPRDKRNVSAMASARSSYDVHLTGRGLTTVWGRLISKCWQWLEPSRMSPNTRRAFRNDARVSELLSEADLVVVQWTEMMSVLPAAPARAPWLMVHDVMTQREERKLASVPLRNLLRRGLQISRIAETVRREGQLLAMASLVVALSEKDAVLARNLAPDSRVEWIDPPLWDGREGAFLGRRGVGSKLVIMVGAFNRPENHDGAIWLLRHVWPTVLAGHPDASLMLVGSHPGKALFELARNESSVSITGYVSSLENYYERAAVAVVPLRAGAGIKFKAIDALLRDVPVVATTVGAEGIHGPDGGHPFVVRDDPNEFAAAIRAELESSAATDGALAEWARQRFGFPHFKERLESFMVPPTGGRLSLDNSEPPLPRGGDED